MGYSIKFSLSESASSKIDEITPQIIKLIINSGHAKTITGYNTAAGENKLLIQLNNYEPAYEDEPSDICDAIISNLQELGLSSDVELMSFSCPITRCNIEITLPCIDGIFPNGNNELVDLVAKTYLKHVSMSPLTPSAAKFSVDYAGQKLKLVLEALPSNQRHLMQPVLQAATEELRRTVATTKSAHATSTGYHRQVSVSSLFTPGFSNSSAGAARLDVTLSSELHDHELDSHCHSVNVLLRNRFSISSSMPRSLIRSGYLIEGRIQETTIPNTYAVAVTSTRGNMTLRDVLLELSRTSSDCEILGCKANSFGSFSRVPHNLEKSNDQRMRFGR